MLVFLPTEEELEEIEKLAEAKLERIFVEEPSEREDKDEETLVWLSELQ